MHELWRNPTQMLCVLHRFPSKVGERMKPSGCPSPAPNHFTQLLQIISQIRPCYLSLTFTVLQIFLEVFFLERESYLEEGKPRQNISLIISKSWRQRVRDVLWDLSSITLHSFLAPGRRGSSCTARSSTSA